MYGYKLGLSKNERTALFRKLVQNLIICEKIETTEAKAKAIKGLIDKIINQAKSPATRSITAQFLINKTAFDKLTKDLLSRLQTRNSGYTSVVKVGRRLGDNAMMVRMSLLTEEPAKMKKGEEKVTRSKARTKK